MHQQILFASLSSGSYTIDNSFAFHKANDEALERTISGSSTLATKGTLSLWLKRTDIGSGYQGIFASNNGTAGASGGQDAVVFTSDKVELWLAAGQDDITWSPVFRDTSSFYHFVFSIDTTQATDTNRVKFYVNGTQITDTSAANWPVQDQVMRGFAYSSGTTTQVFGTDMSATSTASRWEAGFILGGDAIWVDGSALTPSSFGEINEDTGIWTPIKPDVTYGNHGFRLEFKETGTSQNSSGMGADTSGNNSHWALKHSSTITAAKNRQVDVPTDDADNSLGNYATWNPRKFMNDNLSAYSFTHGNLRVTGDSGSSGNNGLFSTVGLSGKHYAETKILGSSNISGGRSAFGILESTATNASNTTCLSHSSFSGISLGEAIVYAGGSSGNNYTDVSVNDVIGIAVDVDAGKMWIRVNSNAWLTTGSAGDPATGANPTLTFTAGTDYYWACYCYNASDILETTFGQTAYATSAPSGFGGTHTASATAPAISKPSDHFDAILYTGTGSELAISSLDFQPDMVWIKNRDANDNNMVYDAVRGATKEWHTNTNDAETTTAQTLKSLDSDGFTLGTDVQVNTSSEKYVAWCWKAGGSGATVSGGMTKTSDSSTTDIVRSTNTSAGFSIITYTGNGANSTIAHGLGVVPGMVWYKRRDSTANCQVWHKSFSSTTRGYLNLADDETEAAFGDDRYYGDQAPTSSIIGVGDHADLNGSTNTYVAYVWAPIEGFSAFGSYTGNANADGPYVYLGFQPAFMIIKVIDGTDNDWNLIDDQRLIAGNDGDRVYLAANDKSGGHTEQNPGDSSQDLDILSNGFKVRNSSNALNKSGQKFIYAAWANTPFASNNRGF